MFEGVVQGLRRVAKLMLLRLPAQVRLSVYRWRSEGGRPLNRVSDAAVGADVKWSAVYDAAETAPVPKIRTWLEIPKVSKRYHEKITGGSKSSWVGYCIEFAASTAKGPLNMVSLGCGTGGLERDLATHGSFGSCDAIDISAAAVGIAQRQARDAGMASIYYRCDDLNSVVLPTKVYHAAWFNMSLHHVTELERLLDQVAESLRPEGWLFVHEYIGANRFDFPVAQKSMLKCANLLIPEEFRRVGELIRKDPPIPDPVAVFADDPSEAVRSQDIEKALGVRFEVLHRHEAGGSLLQYALNDIATNFTQNTPGTDEVLEMLFAIEDAHSATGLVPSDFALFVAKVRG